VGDAAAGTDEKHGEVVVAGPVRSGAAAPAATSGAPSGHRAGGSSADQRLVADCAARYDVGLERRFPEGSGVEASDGCCVIIAAAILGDAETALRLKPQGRSTTCDSVLPESCGLDLHQREKR
jgi:hypothetical protein